jgi:hypothetical protein
VSWAPDGTSVVYDGPAGTFQVKVTGERKPERLVSEPRAAVSAQVSPNARWLAYQLGVGAGPRIFVKPYGAGEGKYQVSSDSAVNPRWRADGRELFFLEAGLPRAPRGDLVAVEVGANAASLDRGASHPLFVSEAISFQHPPGGPYQPYAVSRDGQRLLLSRPVGAMTTADDHANAPIAVVLNWAAASK